MNLELDKKVAIVTGGSNGIGLSTAIHFALEGARVIICARNAERMNEAIGEAKKKYSVEMTGIQADMSKADDIKSFVAKAYGLHGRIDILVNNAGMGSEEKIVSASDERWQYYWDLHVIAAVRMAREIVPLMEKSQWGAITNIASICAKQPLDYEPIYNVTKAALVMLSKCLADEVIDRGIRVNSINPGYTLTPDWIKTATSLGKKEGISWEKYIDRLAVERTPIKRFATTDEIAKFIVFISSPAASYCVGSSFVVDGGALKAIN